MEKSVWEKDIRTKRREKDESFIADPQSPIPLDNRFKFEGLNYYLPDSGRRFELKLHEYGNKEILEMEDTGGNRRRFIRWGEFNFKISDTDCKLQAYRSSPEEERLFIPFRDATSGKETYGAGRYLDLESGRDQTSDGKWILDFNKAYNPWCAYNKDYACPFTPPENWLKIEIGAGEKDFNHKDK